MVVKMMRWRPWPPMVAKKFEVTVVVRRLEGFNDGNTHNHQVREGGEEKEKGGSGAAGEARLLTVEIRWKGPKVALSSLRRNVVKREFTKEVGENGGVFEWEEEFQSVCNLSAYKDNNVFHPWEIGFTLLNGSKQGLKNKVPAVGVASLNLAEFSSRAEDKEFELSIPLNVVGGDAESQPLLCITLSLLELRTAPEPAESVDRSIVAAPSPCQSGEIASSEKDELSALKASLRKVKILTEYVSTRRAKKACRQEEGSEGKCSSRSEDGDLTYPFDSDSLEEFEGGETDEGKEESTVRQSFSYGTLAYANYAGGSFFSGTIINGGDEDWVYYSNRKTDVGCSFSEDSTASVLPPLLAGAKRSILPWRKRKLSFRSPKSKGEPLLKKAYAEEGGDDIDFDRRQLSSEFLPLGRQKSDEDSLANSLLVSEFGDDSFAVGSWEQKEIISRDGHMKLHAQVFFASIDQRSERAAGESACTALVAVIADWFHNNCEMMPIKSQFDYLIQEGSLEWRNLCENEAYRERFPDRHFDLETVLQAKIRPLSVDPGKSFIGFFHPDGIDDDRLRILQGAMSFDGIWEEISCAGSHHPSRLESDLYIVSWNDHFFILKVEAEAYYIIDTLGERLYEGCNQAYILKFDKNTTICKLRQPSEAKAPGDAAASESFNTTNTKWGEEEEEVVCKGKESCKEYIKNFLAAIPIRELLADLKKGLMESTPLHQRLQIELHYTQSLPTLPESSAVESSTGFAKLTEMAITEITA